MRRLVFGLLGVLLLLPLGASPALAGQEDAAESLFADRDLPTLDITVTADAYEGIPASIPAGRYLVTLSVAADAGEFGGGVAFIQPAGMTGEEFIAMLGELLADPDAMSELPDYLFESTYAGGTYAEAGASCQVVLDLAPGEWVAWGDDPEATQQPVAFTVTGEMPADLPEPAAGATLTMGEYTIQVTEGRIVGGPQILRVDIVGAQPHLVTSTTTTVDVTEEGFLALLEGEMTGTPAAVGFNPDEDLVESFYSGTQSTGTSQWIVADVQPGTLVLLCFFPDVSDGMPHAYHGMVDLVEVPA